MDMAVPAEYFHGPMFVGLAINICLLGIMTTQTYLYYAKYSSDKKWIKAFVALLYALNVANSVSLFIFLYSTLITSFGDFAVLDNLTWCFAVGGLKRKEAIIIVFTLNLLLGDPILGISIAAIRESSRLSSNLFRIEILSLTKTMLCFILITVPAATAAGPGYHLVGVRCGQRVLSFLSFSFIFCNSPYWSNLNRQSRKLGMKRSDIVVDRIIRFTIQTGLFTVVVAILDIIFFLTNKSGMYVKSKGKITAPLYPVKDTYY
ncbi:hypothetical protein CPB84DRAFT_1880920 [Gymnopilus junonius]|uniref:Uncharacterized protein n=1 Tax=Gymnopilus junonius TaxID=109634 RepID=A0A9P5TG68_GYMJU|nr:hypothetical protein CPB84DRAFT_1880920 [Gymnopilus junonius]